jgi:tetratricopeptide (TPR) repeat protein
LKGLTLSSMKAFCTGLALFPALLLAGPAAPAPDKAGMDDSTQVSGEVAPETFTPALLEKYNADIRKNPSSLKRRNGRASILLSHEEYRETTGEDIDSLLAHPVWRAQGQRRKAMHLYLLGRTDEADVLMRQNIRNNNNVVEQSRWLARIELSRRDTAAALDVYRFAWEQHPREETFIELLGAYRRHGRAPEKALLERGLRLFPTDAGVASIVFDAYLASGKKKDLQRGLEISGRSEKTWPRSIDWKIKRAQAFLALKRPRDAEGVLLRAVDLMDSDPRLEGENGVLRTQVLLLLENAPANGP